jgi:hypothetical protein
MNTLETLKAARLATVYEFRPLPGELGAGMRRYADGQWLEDDGEHDLAFINNGYGPPVCLMFEPGYQSNIIYSWLTGHWSGKVSSHPRGNAWHYALAEGETEWGGAWGRENHPNYKAGRSGMDKLCSERSCANGRHVEFRNNDRHVSEGLVRNRETKEVFRFADGMKCMYCGIEPELAAFDEAIARLEAK